MHEPSQPESQITVSCHHRNTTLLNTKKHSDMSDLSTRTK